MEVYRNETTGESLVKTEGGGMCDTLTGITSYDTDVINKIIMWADEEGSEWVTESIEPNIFDVIPTCKSLDGDLLDDKVAC